MELNVGIGQPGQRSGFEVMKLHLGQTADHVSDVTYDDSSTLKITLLRSDQDDDDVAAVRIASCLLRCCYGTNESLAYQAASDRMSLNS